MRLSTIVTLVKHALSISFLVFLMMLLVEYLNVISKGKWEAYFCRQRGWMQYVWAAMLGLLPGCLGAFAAVTLYSHRLPRRSFRETEPGSKFIFIHPRARLLSLLQIPTLCRGRSMHGVFCPQACTAGLRRRINIIIGLLVGISWIFLAG